MESKVTKNIKISGTTFSCKITMSHTYSEVKLGQSDIKCSPSSPGGLTAKQVEFSVNGYTFKINANINPTKLLSAKIVSAPKTTTTTTTTTSTTTTSTTTTSTTTTLFNYDGTNHIVYLYSFGYFFWPFFPLQVAPVFLTLSFTSPTKPSPWTLAWPTELVNSPSHGRRQEDKLSSWTDLVLVSNTISSPQLYYESFLLFRSLQSQVHNSCQPIQSSSAKSRRQADGHVHVLLLLHPEGGHQHHRSHHGLVDQ